MQMLITFVDWLATLLNVIVAYGLLWMLVDQQMFHILKLKVDKCIGAETAEKSDRPQQ